MIIESVRDNLKKHIQFRRPIVPDIAHGCNSVLATSTALRLADYTVTEAGFGADLGAEKFLDIKTPNLPTSPDAVIIVATLRALKMNGGVAKDALTEEKSSIRAPRSPFSPKCPCRHVKPQ